jgi:hypothetical protein
MTAVERAAQPSITPSFIDAVNALVRRFSQILTRLN